MHETHNGGKCMSRYRVECPFCIVAMRDRMEYTCSHPVDLLAVRNIGPTIASKAIGTIAFGLPAHAHKKLTESRQRPDGDNKEKSIYRKTKTAPTRLESRGGFLSFTCRKSRIHDTKILRHLLVDVLAVDTSSTFGCPCHHSICDRNSSCAYPPGSAAPPALHSPCQ